MTNTVTVNWKGDMHFIAENPPGVEIALDSSASAEDAKGASPKALMLTALGGCTAMDVSSLLKKMRAEVRDFKIIVSGDLTEEHPKYYHSVRMKYQFFGTDFKKDKIEKAVNLSIERYCGVMEMFRGFAKVETSIEYIEE